jgi:hypothetical protein
MGKTTTQVPAESLEWYEKLIATHAGVERKGAAMPYTSLNGHMFSFLTETGTLSLRLAANEREKFLRKFKTTLCERHGSVMEEYVVVPGDLLKNTRELKKYFAASYAYVASLKPKPTTRKSGGGKAGKRSAGRNR